MLLNGYAGYSAYLVCSTDADWLPSFEMEDTHWSLDQANGSDTLFSREGVRNTVYHRFSDFFAEFRKEHTKEMGLAPFPCTSKGTPKQPTLSVARLFENCIASTKVKSILYNPSYKGLMVDALASGADEGRGRLRKASMSCQASFESGMSELGNQTGVMPSHSGLNT